MTIDSVELQRRLDSFTEACRKSRIKLTPQRLEIYREVAASGDHPDAETIARGVRQRIPSISLDTVYRTLWFLHDLGLISTLGSRRESVRFDGNPRPHHHYVCARCGLMRDFESAEFDALHLPESVRKFGTILTTRVEVSGLCARCATELPAGPPSGRPVAENQ